MFFLDVGFRVKNTITLLETVWAISVFWNVTELYRYFQGSRSSIFALYVCISTASIFFFNQKCFVESSRFRGLCSWFHLLQVVFINSAANLRLWPTFASSQAFNLWTSRLRKTRLCASLPWPMRVHLITYSWDQNHFLFSWNQKSPDPFFREQDFESRLNCKWESSKFSDNIGLSLRKRCPAVINFFKIFFFSGSVQQPRVTRPNHKNRHVEGRKPNSVRNFGRRERQCRDYRWSSVLLALAWFQILPI